MSGGRLVVVEAAKWLEVATVGSGRMCESSGRGVCRGV